MTTKSKAVFLDRDGVLNREMGDYVCRFEDFHVLEHNFEALKELQDRGYLLIVATNQGGLDKKWYTEAQLAEMHAHLKSICARHGITFTDIYYCPHHPNFTGECDCRKPKPGMLLRGIAQYNIDPAASILLATANVMWKQARQPV